MLMDCRPTVVFLFLHGNVVVRAFRGGLPVVVRTSGARIEYEVAHCWLLGAVHADALRHDRIPDVRLVRVHVHQPQVARDLTRRATAGSARPAGGGRGAYRGERAHRVARVAALLLEALEDAPLRDDAARHERERAVEVAVDEPRVARRGHVRVLARPHAQDQRYRLLPLGLEQRESDRVRRDRGRAKALHPLACFSVALCGEWVRSYRSS